MNWQHFPPEVNSGSALPADVVEKCAAEAPKRTARPTVTMIDVVDDGQVIKTVVVVPLDVV